MEKKRRPLVARTSSRAGRLNSPKPIEHSSISIRNNKQPTHLASLLFALICVITPTATYLNIPPVDCLFQPSALGRSILSQNNAGAHNFGYQLEADEATSSWTSSQQNTMDQLRQIISHSSMLSDRLSDDNRFLVADNDFGGQLYRPNQASYASNDDRLAADGQAQDDQSLDSPRALAAPLANEIYILEDKDYPKSIYEDYSRKVGQVSGITALPNDDVAIFHRAERQWTLDTFNETNHQLVGEPSPGLANEHLIKNDTIMILDGDNGNSVTSFGSNLFYMPHSIASDPSGNIWVSDVGRHQVMRLPVANFMKFRAQQRDSGAPTKLAPLGDWLPANLSTIWPDIVLGESFVPGSDERHFCQPSELAVSSDGRLLYVADGYCNKRIMVYSALSGQFLTSFGANGIPPQPLVADDQLDFSVVHSLTLIEEKNLLCVADRDNGRILCYSAGLDGDLGSIGRLITRCKYPIGRVFAIQAISQDHLLVSSNQANTKRYDMAILNPFTEELKLVWTSSDLLEPHSLARTTDKQYAYAADLSKDAYKKVFKFNIIQRLANF